MSAQLISALESLQTETDSTRRSQANEYLTAFQHSPEAWQVSHEILSSPGTSSLSALLFSSQTLRSKITYDLSTLPPASLQPLLQSLLGFLRQYTQPLPNDSHSSPRPVLIQISLALASLAVQMTEWENPVQSMISQFGQEQGMVQALLEFLRVLPEEVGWGGRARGAGEDSTNRTVDLLSTSSEQVLKLLEMYIVAPGLDFKTQNLTYEALRSWLRAGELFPPQIISTTTPGVSGPFVTSIFSSILPNNPTIFDCAVDLLVDLIHETQELEENAASIQQLLPPLLSILPALDSPDVFEDAEQMRGLTRVFVEAGETWRVLLLSHPTAFFPILTGILKCASFGEDLEIPRITFQFWYRFASTLGKRGSETQSQLPSDQLQQFLTVYDQLLEIIINHLKYPSDDEGPMNGAERDEFRNFRHYMGDVLKDCCKVLGGDVGLTKAVKILQSHPSSWQEVEAPLFSMRAMGAEISSSDDEVIPHIFALLPTLPVHPRIRYAAILVLGRYTEWIKRTCDANEEEGKKVLEWALGFVTNAFSGGAGDGDEEVMAAAAQTMNYMCKDCKQYLVPYLAQLHTFLITATPQMIPEDVLKVSEAIAHILSCVSPVPNAQQALRTFVLPLLEKVQMITQRTDEPTKTELGAVGDILEQLEVFLDPRIVGDKMTSEATTPSCSETFLSGWQILDAFLARYGHVWFISEPACKLIRQALFFFGPSARMSALAILDRMASCFEKSSLAGYIWITARIAGLYGNKGSDPEVMLAVVRAWERETIVISGIAESAGGRVSEIPDVMYDYLHVFLELVEYAPTLFFASPAFPQAFALIAACLAITTSPGTVMCSLEAVDMILRLFLSNSAPPEVIIKIKDVFFQNGGLLTSLLLTGLVTDFPEDAPTLAITSIKDLSTICPQEMVVWLPPVVESLPPTKVPPKDKQAFMEKFGSSLTGSNADGIKSAVQNIYRASRRAKDRVRDRRD